MIITQWSQLLFKIQGEEEVQLENILQMKNKKRSRLRMCLKIRIICFNKELTLFSLIFIQHYDLFDKLHKMVKGAEV